MIKVLQIGMSFEVGGTETFLYNHYKELNRDEIRFDFITYRDTISYEEELTKMGSKIHKITAARKNPFLSFKQFVDVIEQNEYDIIHINISSFANIIPILAAKKGKVPKIILHSHNNGMEEDKLKIVLHNLNKFITKKMKIQRF